MTTLLGADDAVVLRLTHASVAGVEIRDGAEEKGATVQQQNRGDFSKMER